MPEQQQLQQKVHENKGSLTDPTSNVLMLVEAATKRQDDLSELRQIFNDRLITAEVKRLDDLAKQKSEFDEKIRVAEKERIDAIRAVDVAARQSDNDKAIQQASVLAEQVKRTDENLQSLIRQATAAQEARLAALEKAQYENQGKSTVADPMMEEMVKEMKMLRLTQGTNAGKGAGISSMVALGFAIISAIGVIVMIIINVMR